MHVINRRVAYLAGVSESQLAAVRARAEAERRAAAYRARRARLPLGGRIAGIVDDGIATGSTAPSACQIARAQRAARVVVAVPVARLGWEAGIGGETDELVCVTAPRDFFAIGQFYANFSQVADDEVIGCHLPVGYFGASTGAAAALARDWFSSYLARTAHPAR